MIAMAGRPRTTAEVPPGYIVRAARWEDLPAVAALITARGMDWGTPDTTADILRSDWWDHPAMDRAKDTWIVERCGRVCGHALVLATSREELYAWWVVAPDNPEPRLDSLLVELIEERAREQAGMTGEGAVVVLRVTVTGPDRAPHDLLGRRGFLPARHFWRMDRRLDQKPPPPEAPEGIAIRSFQRGVDERAVHAVFEEAFAGSWGFVSMPFDEWATLRLGWEGFDPSLWFVAVDDAITLGALAARVVGGTGWISSLGVRPRDRGRGIATALLRTSFAEFHRRGVANASLYVDAANETGATALYERVGMRVAKRDDMYEKRV